MEDDQVRATFDFAGARDVRYIRVPPEIGDFVVRMSEFWIVRKVETHDLGKLITCELPRAPEPGLPAA